MWYVGFLGVDLNRMVVFSDEQTPTKRKYPYLGKVLGPYVEEWEARNTMKVLRRGYGYVENPAYSERQRKFMCAELGRLRSGKRTKTKMTGRQLRDYCKKNPGEAYHNRKFLSYIADLEKYKVGSQPYIVTLAKAYEHLESSMDSM